MCVYALLSQDKIKKAYTEGHIHYDRIGQFKNVVSEIDWTTEPVPTYVVYTRNRKEVKLPTGIIELQQQGVIRVDWNPSHHPLFPLTASEYVHLL
jgi:hypothetical protein